VPSKKKKFICKVDLDAAFCQGTLAGSTAMECQTIFNNMLFMALRMNFEGAPCPSLWGIISESLSDMANSLIHNTHWSHLELYDDLSDTLDHPSSLLEYIPFHQAKELAFSLPPNDMGQVDIYIDDMIGITPGIEDNTCRVSRAIPLAIWTIARLISDSDIIPRHDIISLKNIKLKDSWANKKTSSGGYSKLGPYASIYLNTNRESGAMKFKKL
jgi:hypothetical protein